MSRIFNLMFLSRHFAQSYPFIFYPLESQIEIEHSYFNWKNANYLRGLHNKYERLRYGACWHDKSDNYHELYEEKYDIDTWPTANMELLVAYFDKNSSLHPYPNNLIVYNADGSIRHIVPPPVLATQPDRRKVLIGYPNGMGTPMDPKHQEQNLIEVVYFSSDLWVREKSLLDPYSGKLVQVLRSEKITDQRML